MSDKGKIIRETFAILVPENDYRGRKFGEMRVDSVGLMTGLGFGLMYLPAIDIIEVYFDRKEETASAYCISLVFYSYNSCDTATIMSL